jgi:hypothetical protein
MSGGPHTGKCFDVSYPRLLDFRVPTGFVHLEINFHFSSCPVSKIAHFHVFQQGTTNYYHCNIVVL